MIFQDIQIRLRSVLGSIIALALMGYFVYHIIQGERGLLSWMRLKQKIHETEQQLADTQSRQETLERQVSLLRPDSLDPDMLEERARLILNFARKDEIVVRDEGALPEASEKKTSSSK